MDQLVINLNCFKIIKNIGNGNFGRVFLVQNTITNREYAAKVSIHEYYSEDLQKSFLNEITSYPKIKYPSILSLFGYNLLNFDYKPFPTIVTDYMPNGSLDCMLDKEYHSLAPHQFSNSKKYIILLGIAFGMNFLHSQRIVHRDLKPQNILLDENFYPHICDFGLSVLSELQMPDIVMESGVGTPLYMAPEIISGKPYTYKVDVYAFSLIAYELLTGKPPFEGYRSIFHLQDEVKKGKRPDLTFIPDEDIRIFLQKCWSNDPQERPNFNSIADEILKEKYKYAFGASEEEVAEYLDLFDQDQNLFSNDYLQIQKDADQGDVKSMVKFGVMLRHGESVDVDKKEAARYLRMASELGDAEAMYNYGVMLNTGEGIPKNKKEAARYLRKSADLGEAIAMREYGRMLDSGDGIAVNKKEAARYYKMSADRGETIAMYEYARMLDRGDGIHANKPEAARYYKMSADQGNIKAMENYGTMLYSGKGVPPDKREASRYFKMAADQGNVSSMQSYGAMLRKGDGIDMNKTESLRYLQLASTKGDTNSMLTIGDMYINGEIPNNNKSKSDSGCSGCGGCGGCGGCVDRLMAAKFYKMSADKGNALAMFKYGSLIRCGEGLVVDKSEAVRYFRLAATRGDSEAMFVYADMVDMGEGVKCDKKEAAKYFKMAASKGNTDAMFRYGVMLHAGDGISKNRKEAARFFKMAASRGDPNAMYNYGMMLRSGDGIPANRKEADRYLNMAAINGNSIAITELFNPSVIQ